MFLNSYVGEFSEHTPTIDLCYWVARREECILNIQPNTGYSPGCAVDRRHSPEGDCNKANVCFDVNCANIHVQTLLLIATSSFIDSTVL